jgi:hypothetical protein
MVKATLLLRHVYQEHFHDLACHHSRVLHEFISLIISAGGREVLAHRIHVGLGVE